MVNREIPKHVSRIIDEPLEVIEQEYGLDGIDRVIQVASNRRRCMLSKLQAEREKSLRFQGEAIQAD